MRTISPSVLDARAAVALKPCNMVSTTAWTTSPFPSAPLMTYSSGAASVRFMSTTAATGAAEGAEGAAKHPEVVITDAAEAPTGWTSKAFRSKSEVNYENISTGPRKLARLCRMIRGMSAREAMAQLSLSEWKKAPFLMAAIRTATHHGVNGFNMDKSRLVVKDVYATKAKYYKRVEFRKGGSANVKHLRHSHLHLSLEEQPYHPHEIRIGRYGRTIANLQKVDSVVSAFKQRRAEVKSQAQAVTEAAMAAKLKEAMEKMKA